MMPQPWHRKLCSCTDMATRGIKGLSKGVMCSCHRVPVTNQTAASWTDEWRSNHITWSCNSQVSVASYNDNNTSICKAHNVSRNAESEASFDSCLPNFTAICELSTLHSHTHKATSKLNKGAKQETCSVYQVNCEAQINQHQWINEQTMSSHRQMVR